MAILNDDVKTGYKALNDRWKIIKKSKNNRSITRLAKDSIMQFPLVFSDSLPMDKSPLIVKGLESMLAAQVVMHLSTHANIDMKQYDGIVEYLKTFTNTNAIPDNLAFAPDALKGVKTVMGMESASMNPYPRVGIFEPSAVLECLLEPEDIVAKESLNDLYQPYKETIRAMEAAIVEGHKKLAAMEANTTPTNNTKFDPLNDSRFSGGADARAAINKHKAMIKDIEDGTDSAVAQAKNRGAVVNNPNVSVKYPNEAFLEPTMVECQFVLYGTDGSHVTQNATFGVKVMPRVIPSGAMVNNLDSTLDSNNIGFKFLKWRAGELKFAKAFFGLSSIKDDARAANKSADKLFASLRSLRRKSNIGNWTGKNIPVTTTFIITSLEAEQIKQQTGYDLYDEANASIIMRKLHCLGFGIYNVDSERLDMLFDGYGDYMSLSLTAMNKAMRGNSDTILKDITNLMSLSLKR